MVTSQSFLLEKQKASFDQMFSTYMYAVYYYKLLQRSKTFLALVSYMLVLYTRKTTASFGPKSISGLCLERLLAELLCAHLLQLTHRPFCSDKAWTPTLVFSTSSSFFNPLIPTWLLISQLMFSTEFLETLPHTFLVESN